MSLALTGCNKYNIFSKKTNTESDNAIEEIKQTIKIGNIDFEYDPNEMNINKGHIFNVGNDTLQFTDPSIDVNADRPNDEVFKFPVLYFNLLKDATKNLSITSEEDVHNISIFSNIPIEEVKKHNDYFSVNIKIIDKNVKKRYLLASDYYYIIPSNNVDDNNIYLITLMNGNKIDENGMSGIEYTIFEYGYNVVKDTINTLSNSTIFNEYDITADSLNSYINSIDNLKGDTDLESSASNESTIKIIGGSGATIDADIEELTSINENQDTVDPDDVGRTDYSLNELNDVYIENPGKTYKISEQDLIDKAKTCYEVGVDIPEGSYYIKNNLVSKYNADGSTNQSSVHPGVMYVYSGLEYQRYIDGHSQEFSEQDTSVESIEDLETIDENIIESIEDTSASADVEPSKSENNNEYQDSDDIEYTYYEPVVPSITILPIDYMYAYEVSNSNPFSDGYDTFITLSAGDRIMIQGLDLSLIEDASN